MFRSLRLSEGTSTWPTSHTPTVPLNVPAGPLSPETATRTLVRLASGPQGERRQHLEGPGSNAEGVLLEAPRP